ncbi:MAG TPA: Rrf2 family transcriptional regulator [Atribacteraceae bacterium]|nr:Rrf2 family transcriptional regulator [Atribacteraceae bacterium]
MSGLFQLNEATSIAFHGMALLTAADTPLSSGHLARETGSSEAHLAKVMRRLAQAGLVTATRGPGGGFTLAKAAVNIVLLDIYQAIEGPFTTNECILNRKNCPFQCCLFGGFLENITGEFKDFLTRRILADLVSFSPIKPLVRK